MEKEVSKWIGVILFVPFALIMLLMGLGLTWALVYYVPFGGGLIAFAVCLGILAVALKSFEWSMAFDSSSKQILIPYLKSGFKRATTLNAWQAGLLISSSLFAVGLLWHFVF